MASDEFGWKVYPDGWIAGGWGVGGDGDVWIGPFDWIKQPGDGI